MTEQNYGQSDQYERQGEESGWYPQQGWQAPEQRRYSSSSSRYGGAGTMLTNGFAFLAGFASGAAAMYLLDPERGHDRRAHLGDAAHEAFDGTTSALSSAWGHLREHGANAAEHARDLGHRATHAASDYAGRAGGAAGGAGSAISGFFGGLMGRAQTAGHNLSDRARHWWSGKDERTHYTGYAAGGLGLLILGGAAMYLLDPNRGAGRRAKLRDRFFSTVSYMGGCARGVGQQLVGRGRGLYHSARHMIVREGEIEDQRLEARVRSQLGRVVSHPHSIRVSANHGCITLLGPVLADELDNLLAAVNSVHGVQDVRNELDVHSSTIGVPGLQA